MDATSTEDLKTLLVILTAAGVTRYKTPQLELEFLPLHAKHPVSNGTFPVKFDPPTPDYVSPYHELFQGKPPTLSPTTKKAE